MRADPFDEFANRRGLIALGLEFRDDLEPAPAFRFLRALRAMRRPGRAVAQIGVAEFEQRLQRFHRRRRAGHAARMRIGGGVDNSPAALRRARPASPSARGSAAPRDARRADGRRAWRPWRASSGERAWRVSAWRQYGGKRARGEGGPPGPSLSPRLSPNFSKFRGVFSKDFQAFRWREFTISRCCKGKKENSLSANFYGADGSDGEGDAVFVPRIPIFRKEMSKPALPSPCGREDGKGRRRRDKCNAQSPLRANQVLAGLLRTIERYIEISPRNIRDHVMPLSPSDSADPLDFDERHRLGLRRQQFLAVG